MKDTHVNVPNGNREFAKTIHEVCMCEVIRQVTVHCIERGRLLSELFEDLNIQHAKTVESINEEIQEAKKHNEYETACIKTKLRNRLADCKRKLQNMEEMYEESSQESIKYKGKLERVSCDYEELLHKYNDTFNQKAKRPIGFQGGIMPSTSSRTRSIPDRSVKSETSMKGPPSISGDLNLIIPQDSGLSIESFSYKYIDSPKQFSEIAAQTEGVFDHEILESKETTFEGPLQFDYPLGQVANEEVPKNPTEPDMEVISTLQIDESMEHLSLDIEMSELAQIPHHILSRLNSLIKLSNQLQYTTEILPPLFIQDLKDHLNSVKSRIASTEPHLCFFGKISKQYSDISLSEPREIPESIISIVPDDSLWAAEHLHRAKSATEDILPAFQTEREYSLYDITEKYEPDPSPLNSTKARHASLIVNQKSRDYLGDHEGNRPQRFSTNLPEQSGMNRRFTTVVKEFHFNVKDAFHKKRLQAGSKLLANYLKHRLSSILKKSTMSKKMVLKLISFIYNSYVIKARTVDDELVESLYEEFTQKYGLKSVSDKKFLEFISSLYLLKDTSRVKTFIQLIGCGYKIGLKEYSRYTQYTAAHIWRYMQLSNIGVMLPLDESSDKIYFPILRVLECAKEKFEHTISREEYLQLLAETENSAVPDPKRINIPGIIDIDIFLDLCLKTQENYQEDIQDGVNVLAQILESSPDLKLGNLEFGMFISQLDPTRRFPINDEDFCNELNEHHVFIEKLLNKSVETGCFRMSHMKLYCPQMDAATKDSVSQEIRDTEGSIQRILAESRAKNQYKYSEYIIQTRLEGLASSFSTANPSAVALGWALYSSELHKVHNP